MTPSLAQNPLAEKARNDLFQTPLPSRLLGKSVVADATKGRALPNKGTHLINWRNALNGKNFCGI